MTVLVALASLVAVAVIGVVGFLLVTRGGQDDASAVQATQSPATLPSEASSQPVPRPTRTATVFVTVAPQEPAGETTGGASSATGELTEAEAVAGIQDYLRTVVGDPAAGWDALTGRRQAIEDRDSYYRYWSSLSSASVSGCALDPGTGALSCRLSTVDLAGKAASSDVRFWLSVEDGATLVDVAGGGGAGQVAAEQRLEEQRQVTLRTLVLDGRWVAELSAKRPGISDPLQTAANGSHVFYFDDILAEHDKLVARFPGTDVMMLRRQDWGRQGRDLWHTVADPGGLASKADVEAWCARSFPELSGEALTNQCTPRQMTAPHSG